jgi:lactate 2-monooxygenase
MQRAGGRQIDDAISAFSPLEKITASSRVLRAQKEGTFTVLFDLGIRQGSDVIKAIAMGAQGVLGMDMFYSADSPRPLLH